MSDKNDDRYANFFFGGNSVNGTYLMVLYAVVMIVVLSTLFWLVW